MYVILGPVSWYELVNCALLIFLGMAPYSGIVSEVAGVVDVVKPMLNIGEITKSERWRNQHERKSNANLFYLLSAV